MLGYQLAVFVLAIAFLWALLSWATVPSVYQQEHELRLEAQTQVAIQSTRVAVLSQQVPTRPSYPYAGYHP